jgi:hypothetical protein
MNRDENIEFLQGLTAGTRSIHELIENNEAEKEAEAIIKKMTGPELGRDLKNGQLYGEEIDDWPEIEQSFYYRMMEDIEARASIEHLYELAIGVYLIHYTDNRPAIVHMEKEFVRIGNEFHQLLITDLDVDEIDYLKITKWELDIIFQIKVCKSDGLDIPVDVAHQYKLILDNLLLRTSIKKSFSYEDFYNIYYKNLDYPIVVRWKDHAKKYSIHY